MQVLCEATLWWPVERRLRRVLALHELQIVPLADVFTNRMHMAP